MLRLEINPVLHSKKSKVNKACSLDDQSLKKITITLQKLRIQMKIKGVLQIIIHEGLGYVIPYTFFVTSINLLNFAEMMT